MGDPIKEASESGWIASHREQYLSDPQAGHMWDSKPAGGKGPIPTLLLTTIGRKSGTKSVMPLIYIEHDGSQDEVTVQVIDDEFQAEVRVAAGEERAGIWEKAVELYPPYADYKVNAGDREIPVMILERIS